ncbi:response regulator [Pseudomonas abietaniphila]|uniref:Response regulator receiver domain-containing protein n=1 Tax=Pseudomonas abietaniphila TaxID=89065 RepID=A0A1G8UG40_9PSED|nr:response regulator [Pseudomonas abietaniphila]SDJ52836.1 Response regulator receiver domain-containing protein [Pseudomonas abietaniphila]
MIQMDYWRPSARSETIPATNWGAGKQVLTNWEGILPIEGSIVVVEDDDILRTVMTEILTDIGAHYVAFVTADDALIHMLKNADGTALVIADHGVPGQIRGAEFLSMVAQRWPGLPSILTSGYELDASLVPEKTVYLQKPWSIDVLVIAIAELLQPGIPVRRI